MSDFGTCEYPGIIAYEDFSFTDVSGISPAVAVMTVFPQDDAPAANGDLTLRYADYEIVLKKMHIDAANYERNSGGKVVKVRFLDERWQWEFGNISGRYNIRMPNNWVDPQHEKTPQELAELCFKAMGVESFEVSALPNDARPETDWDHANPAQCLQKICDDLGCRIVPQRSTGSWVICVTGEGNELPDEGWPYQDPSEGIDPKEQPDYIKIVTAPWKFQVALRLEAVGRDLDHGWKPLKSLDYCPDKSSKASIKDGYGFGYDVWGMSNIDPKRVRQEDGTAASPREFALQTIFKSFRPTGDGEDRTLKDQKVKIPDFPKGSVDIKRLVLSDELVNVYLDEKGVEHKRPAYVFGRFFLEMVEGDGNCVAGTRVDTQGAIFQESEEERASFSSSIDSLDISKSIVSFSKPMIFNNRDPEKQNRYTFGPATDLFWVTSVEVRDEKTWQPYRLEYLKKLGDGTDESVCLIVIKDDIQPWTVGKYDANGAFVSSTNNKDEVQKQCQYYADAIAATFETVATTRKTFMGLYPVDMDGRICQVSYRISKQGSDTVVSTGTEHDFDIPSYDERCQRWARKNGDRKLQYMESKQKRLDRLKGTSFTI